MAVRQKTLSNRTVAALKVERDTVFWDRDLPGFGVRVYPSGGKVYVAQARERTGKKLPKRVTVGRHDVLNADEARQRAALIIARIRAGEEPLPLPLAARANGGPTVADLTARYLDEHVEVRLKPGTQVRVKGVLRNHILPALGRLPVAAVERSHVVALQQTLSGHPVTANKAVKVLSHMFRLGAGWGLAPEGSNPCRSVEQFPERRRERFLTDAEFARLGRVLDDSIEGGRGSPAAVAAIRLLMLTGCRKSEILALRWPDVDLDAGELHLADAKSGPRAVQLPPTAARLLEALPRRKDSPWVFPGNGRDGHYSAEGLDRVWQTVRARAGLGDVRLHDLRHSFASRALALGETLPVIGKLLGHSDIETTARYAHLARDSVHEAADRIAESIAADILEERDTDHRP
ncbi:MAG: tyrosine-type recombinase/integrase [Rhodospirillaceae bacterium]|nr:tyrosine-type recombinase/integrase [Rhodospirillaceae bacterium]MDE0617537.1 tyrosine-type recombinase/integrase [Rhodospirillaceae bacterium]